MKLGIVSDHRGYQLKEKLKGELKNKNYQILDYGTDSEDSVDYPDFAFLLGEKVVNKEVDYGVALCGSGIGMTIACNKVKGIRCGNFDSVEQVKIAKNDDNINIIALSENTQLENALNMIDTLVTTQFSEIEKYQRRERKIKEYEAKHEC